MGYDVRQGDSLIFLMVSSTNHITGVTGLTPTVLIRKHNGTFQVPLGLVTEIGYGRYQVSGNVGDTNVLGPLSLHAEGTGCDPTDVDYTVVSLQTPEVEITSDTEISIEEVVELARSASSVSVDGMTVAERSASDLIAFEEYLNSKKVKENGVSGWGALGYNKIVPPGAITRDC